MTFFQRQEPLIHVLFDSVCKLIKVLMLRFVKRDIVLAKTPGEPENQANDLQFLEIDVKVAANHLPDDQLDIGESAQKLLKKLKTLDQRIVISGAFSFLKTATEYLLKSLPLGKSFLKDGRCLNPEHRDADWTMSAIKSISKALPVQVNTDALCDEWRLYQTETIPDYWIYKEDREGNKKRVRLDHYWGNVFDIKLLDSVKYPELMKVVKAAIIVSHGNSDVERSFSESGHSITSLRVNLSEVSVNGIRSTKDGLKMTKLETMKISKDFIKLGRYAHHNYNLRLQEEKRRKEEMQMLQEKRLKEKEAQKEKARKVAIDIAAKEKAITKLQKQEEALADEEKAMTQVFETGQSLFQHGNLKLRTAVKKNNMQEIAIAQAILETAEKKLSQAQECLGSNQKKRHHIEKRKQSLLSSFTSKKEKVKL